MKKIPMNRYEVIPRNFYVKKAKYKRAHTDDLLCKKGRIRKHACIFTFLQKEIEGITLKQMK